MNHHLYLLMKAHHFTTIFILFVGIGIGWLLPRGGGDVDAGRVEASSPDDAALRLGPRAAHGHDMSWQSRAAVELAGADRLVTMPKGMLQGVSKLPPVRSCRDELFRKDDEVIGLLRISQQERQTLEKSWALHRAEVESLEASQSSYADLEDGAVAIKVPDLSEVLKPLGEHFRSEVHKSLGPERGELLLNLKQIDRVFTPETGERSYLVRVEATGDGKWRFHMTYRDEENHRVWVGDSVPQEIRHITDAARIEPEISGLNESS